MKILRLRTVLPLVVFLIAGSFDTIRAQTTTASETATRPATSAAAPTTQPIADVQRWFDGLADADADVREASIQKLMALTRDDLPTLRQAVAATKQLELTQTTALHDIVIHVYLSGETYEANGAQGFLGLMQSNDLVDGFVVVKVPEEAVAGEAAAGAERRGVPVGNRLAGFCGYGALRTGDVILAFTIALDLNGQAVAPGVQPNATEFTRNLPDWATLIDVVRRIPGGTHVGFDVLRQGRLMRIPIILSPRPAWAEPGVDFEPLLLERERKSEAYWQKVFAPLVGEMVS